MTSMKRKVCAVLTSRVHYGRMKYILKELLADPCIELTTVLAGAAISDTYGNILPEMERDGIPVDYAIHMIIEGGSPVAMAKTTAIGLMEFATLFQNIRPDILLIRGDRFEMMAPAVAAAYMNVTIAHIEGGDVSGTIDDSVRHAITKLSHLHLTTNHESRERVIRMGEDPSTVFSVGSPDIEFIIRNKDVIDRVPTHIFEPDYSIGGVGDRIDFHKPYLVVMQHPVTTEHTKGKEHMRALLEAVRGIGMQVVFFWPNMDAGADEMSKVVRQFINTDKPKGFYFLKNIPPQDFLALVNHSACLVGNSSTGMKECSYLGTPVVDIGTRQQGRLHGRNVRNVGYDAVAIARAITDQVRHGKYPSEEVYGTGDTTSAVIDIVKNAPLLKQKRMSY